MPGSSKLINIEDVSGRVLIVDDDKSTRMVLRSLLSQQFDVETASSGEEALTICREREPDLIMLDVNMPGLDGYKTCCKLREFTDIPIVFVTASDALDEHIKAFDAGGDDVIIKPVIKEILLRKTSLAIRRGHQTQSIQVEKDSFQNMAMNFLSVSGESGLLQQFIQSSLNCGDIRELGAKLIESIGNFSLDCSVLIREEDAPFILTSHGEPSEVEKTVLKQSVGMGRIFQFKRTLVVNYEHVSVIVNNMPMDESDKSGRVRDNIATLAEMTNSLCGIVLMRRTSHTLAEQFQIAMSTGYATVESLRETSQRAQVDTRILLQELVDNIENSYTWLGTSQSQEKTISATMYAAVDKILALLEAASVVSDNKLNEVISCLHNTSNKKADIDLF